MQILIFRIELDLSIKPIPRNPHAPLPNNNIPPFFRHESNRETSKNEGLADDCTTLTLLEFGCLRSLKNALGLRISEFAVDLPATTTNLL